MDVTEQGTAAGFGDERQRRLAERLREAREYLGLSQQFVAEQTGIPRVAISALENGKRKVEALELEALARLYQYPITYFLDGALEEPASIRALAREARGLTERDREAVLRFAQFLKTYGQQRGRETPSTGTQEGEQQAAPPPLPTRYLTQPAPGWASFANLPTPDPEELSSLLEAQEAPRATFRPPASRVSLR